MSETPKRWFIDADTHITEPADLWLKRMSSKWGDLIPRVRWDAEHNEEAWYVGGFKVSPVGAHAWAGWNKPFPSRPPTFDYIHPAAYDASARLKMMDEVGVYAQVLYPNIIGAGGQSCMRLGDPELMGEIVRAYNDFQIDWIQVNPRRFVPIAAIPFWDVAASVKEVERCAKKGYKGILFTGTPHAFGLPYLADHAWDALWSAAQDAGLSVSIHIGSGEPLEDYDEQHLQLESYAASFARVTLGLYLANAMQIADVLMSGILPRFPKLKFVSVEGGAGWVPFMLETLDYEYHTLQLHKHRPEFEMPPSEYFRRQIYSCLALCEQSSIDRLVDKIGVGNILFETDFPHPNCLYGNVPEVIESKFGNQPQQVQQQILMDNAVKLYGIELN